MTGAPILFEDQTVPLDPLVIEDFLEFSRIFTQTRSPLDHLDIEDFFGVIKDF